MSKEDAPNFRQVRHENCNRCIYLLWAWSKDYYRCSLYDFYVLDRWNNIDDVVCDTFKGVEDE